MNYLVVKIKGGFANQTLQYMVAKAIALKSGRKLVLDCSDYAIGGVLQRLKNNTVQSLSINKIANEFVTYFPFSYCCSMLGVKIFDDNYKLDDILKSNRRLILLDGYWHSEEFINIISKSSFLDFKKSILDLVTPYTKNLINSGVLEGATAIHVRRGDYLDKKYIDIYGVCPVSYYEKSTELIYRTGSSIENFIVLSNDPDWTDKHFGFIRNKIEYESKGFLDDFALMVFSRNYIISNSSFSWLAALTGCQRDSLLISPSIWFKKNSVSGLPLDKFTLIDTKLD